MCICADTVNDISKTKIASFHVGYSLDSGKTIIPSQLIVYSAMVDSVSKSNAFILPVHNPGNDPKKIIPLDFSRLPDFLTNTKNIFERWYPEENILFSYSTNTFEMKNNSYLPVHKVGDYQFSIMPTKYDFDRVDKSKLNINPAAQVSIDAHPDEYSFIVYQFFQKGKLDVTPFGYLCKPSTENTMIIPTIHGHPHENLPDVGIKYIPNMFINYKPKFEDYADFDHEIYGLVKITENNGKINKKDNKDIDNLLKKIECDYLNRHIRLYAPKNFSPQKIKIKGNKINRNMEINPFGYKIMDDLVNDAKDKDLFRSDRMMYANSGSISSSVAQF